MINAVYQLVSPRMLEVTYKELNFSSDVVLRPRFLSICKADQRYYQGARSQAVLNEKLPMALIHECVAEVVYDPAGIFPVGRLLVPIPNTPTKDDSVIAENYRRSSYFRSSGNDGFLQDLISVPRDRLVEIPQDMNLHVAAFTELVSVATHAISRFDKFAHSRREVIGIWGDGNLGYISALLLKYSFPDARLCVFGTVDEKLSYFTFADECYHVDSVPEGCYVDHAFECVGGAGSRPAINQMIDLINPEGTISLMGVSENFVDLNTRMILEKGLRLFGSSRSGRDDFLKTVDCFAKHPQSVHYLENLIGDVVTVKSIPDLHNAFSLDYNRSFGKTIIEWMK